MINQSLPKIIKKILPAVVTIAVAQSPSRLAKAKSSSSKPPASIDSGSGFLVDPSGIVVSNRHIVSSPNNRYTVITNDNKSYPAKIMARDPISDVAILRIKDHHRLPFLKLGNSSRLELGENVIAVGNALGIFRNTVSTGIISGLSRSISAQIDDLSPEEEIHGLIQTDAAINPGNSGGPLINLEGEVVGINMAMMSDAENIGFALPINIVKRDLADLKKFGKIQRPFLGVRYLIIDDNVKKEMRLPVNCGALIKSEKPFAESVIAGSPAKKSGLREKDIILSVNEESVTVRKTIGDILEKLSAGDKIKLKILRQNKKIDISVVLGEKHI